MTSTAALGPNGAGKSTTIDMMPGLLDPASILARRAYVGDTKKA